MCSFERTTGGHYSLLPCESSATAASDPHCRRAEWSMSTSVGPRRRVTAPPRIALGSPQGARGRPRMVPRVPRAIREVLHAIRGDGSPAPTVGTRRWRAWGGRCQQSATRVGCGGWGTGWRYPALRFDAGRRGLRTGVSWGCTTDRSVLAVARSSRSRSPDGRAILAVAQPLGRYVGR